MKMKMNLEKYNRAQDNLTFVAGMSIAVAVLFGIDGYNLITANDLTEFGAVAYPIIVAVSLTVSFVASSLKLYGLRLMKTYR